MSIVSPCIISPPMFQIGQENWGADHSTHALKAESPWLSFVNLKCEPDPLQERKLIELRTKNSIDELLRVQAKFLHVMDPEVIEL